MWLAKVLLVTLAAIALLTFIYYVVPIGPLSNSRVLVRLTLGILVFVAVVVSEVRAILRSDRPMSRAWLSVGIILPLFIFIFASIYVAMALADPATFGGELSRTEALYFTVTVLSTVDSATSRRRPTQLGCHGDPDALGPGPRRRLSQVDRRRRVAPLGPGARLRR
jgi:hypothetical protein